MLNSYFDVNKTEAGCDEVGRGCLAGPVVAAAVILPKHFKHDFLNDSKKLSISQRELLKIEILEIRYLNILPNPPPIKTNSNCFMIHLVFLEQLIMKQKI